MAAVFIHGVPDTYRVWDRVFQELRALGSTDVEALALPGFDSAIPAGFTATKDEYVGWLVGRLEERKRERGQPLDLVGHDWGCLLTARVASLRPDLVRSWAGGGGPVDPTYEWHPLARIFQTPGAGEAWMAKLDPEALARDLAGLEVPADDAIEATQRMDARMKDCILRLYRSALDVGADWALALPKMTSPALVMWGARDRACPVAFAHRLGEATRARRVIELDAGHWFPLQRPAEVARALREHWNDLPTHERGERP